VATNHKTGSALRYAFSRIQKKMRLSGVRSSVIDRTATIGSGSQIVDAVIGKHSYCGYDCTILNANIGNFCSIADQVYIGGSGHPLHFVSTSPAFLSHSGSVKARFAKHDYQDLPKTAIGSDVWIGHGAKIRAGVTIGHGAVIGMGSVVTRDVRPYAIVAGNPARELKRRFDDEMVKSLLSTNWWNWEEKRLRFMGNCFNDPVLFIKKYEA
jgi:acetyltransferase-like isoleucine patch superfamily enzyme